MPGSNNDINVLNQSGLFAAIVGLSRFVEGGESYLKHLGRGYTLGDEVQPFQFYYFLVDGIYPDYPVFLKSLSVVSTLGTPDAYNVISHFPRRRCTSALCKKGCAR